jgi:sigma-E factor negative regulatory protein RseC
MEETGKIIELVGTKAKIEITPSSMCGNCTQAKICNPFSQNKKVIELNNTINGHIGDIVIIEIIEKKRFLATLLVFGLPTLLFVIGVIIGQKIGGDKLAAIFAGAGLVVAYIIIKIINNVIVKKGTDLVKIKENLHQQ